MKFRSFLTLFVVLVAAGCSDEENVKSLSLVVEGDHFVATGAIDSTSPEVVRSALEAHPEIKTIVMQFIPGSVDDDANLIASRLLREHGVKTIVPSGGFVASGGTDMFLAGQVREIGSGACLGVHSWGGGGLFDSKQGKDYPKDDPSHQVYLEYYDDIGIDRDFYWYTLEAADSSGIHYMTNAEINRYGVVTVPIEGNQEATFVGCEEIAVNNQFAD